MLIYLGAQTAARPTRSRTEGAARVFPENRIPRFGANDRAIAARTGIVFPVNISSRGAAARVKNLTASG